MAHEATERNDPEALLAHVAWIRRLAARLVANGSEADDVAQETLHQALRHPPEDAGNPRGWLARVARRVSARMRRGNERRVAREQLVARAAAAASDPPADEALIRASLQRSVVDAVIRLAEPYRSAILLHYLDELPTRDVAARLGVPIETVRTRLKRGLGQLRETLAHEVSVERAGGRREEGLAALALLVSPARGTVAATGAAAGVGILGALTMSLTLKWTAAAALVVVGGIVVTTLSTRSPTKSPSEEANAAGSVKESAAGAEATAPVVRQAAEAADAPARSSEAAPVPKMATTPIAARTITGTVRDDSGARVSGALVAVESAAKGSLADAMRVCDRGRGLLVCAAMPAPPPDAPERAYFPTLTRSGADGRFELPAPDGTAINLAALDLERGIAVRAGVPLPHDAATTELDLVLERGLHVHGRVTDAQGVGLRDAQIWIVTARGNELEIFKADANGDFRSLPLPLDAVRAGIRIEASADDFVDVERSIAPPSLAERDVAVDFRLARATIVRGRVVRSDHATFSSAALGVEARVCGCNVDPSGLANPRDAAKETARLGEDGGWSLHLDGLDLGWVALFVGTRLLDSAPIAAGEPGPDLELDVAEIAATRPVGALTIRVRDAKDGAPVPAFNVAFDPVRSSLPPSAVARPFKRNAESPDGTYTTRELVAATWWLTVKAPGFAPRIVAATATVEQPPPAVTVDLARPSARVVRGTVVDEAGRGVAQARVSILDRDGIPARAGDETTVTDAEGRFECSGVPDGRWYVVAAPKWSDDAAPVTRLAAAAIPIDASEEVAPVTLVLRIAVRVRVTVHADRARIDGPCSFRVLDADGVCVRDDTSATNWIQAFSSRNTFDFDVTPGRVTIEAHCAGAKPGRVDFVTERGGSATIELVPR